MISQSLILDPPRCLVAIVEVRFDPPMPEFTPLQVFRRELFDEAADESDENRSGPVLQANYTLDIEQESVRVILRPDRVGFIHESVGGLEHHLQVLQKLLNKLSDRLRDRAVARVGARTQWVVPVSVGWDELLQGYAETFLAGSHPDLSDTVVTYEYAPQEHRYARVTTGPMMTKQLEEEILPFKRAGEGLSDHFLFLDVDHYTRDDTFGYRPSQITGLLRQGARYAEEKTMAIADEFRSQTG